MQPNDGHETPLFARDHGPRSQNYLLRVVILGVVLVAWLAPRANASEGCPNGSLRTGLSARLPDCRAYEQVSPVEKGVAEAGPYPEGAKYVGTQASVSGESVVYTATNALAGSPAGGATSYLGSRDAGGWVTAPLSPPNLVSAIQRSGAYRWFSEDLSCGIVESEEPLTADTPAADTVAETSNLYLRIGDGSWTLLSNATPLNPTPGRGLSQYVVAGATTGCARVFFDTRYRLLSEAPAGVPSLYEWDEGTLRLVDILPDGSTPTSGVVVVGESLSAGFASPWNVVSEDGSRAFFTARSDEGADAGNSEVFVREGNGTAGAKTTEVSVSQTSSPDAGATFQAASSDGSRVFFTANAGLTSSSSAAGVDLYEYDLNTQRLSDLSVDANSADTNGASVAGVLGISEDGSDIYFAATGQLLEGSGGAQENTQATNETSGETNIYFAHEGRLSFVGTVTQAETSNESGSGSDVLTDFNNWSARVTPDGRHLLFVSKTDVTGYDNKDAMTGEPDAEAYLYSAETGEAVCVSCDPSGAPPVSVAEVTPFGTVFKQPFPIRSLEAFPEATSGVPRALSEDGDRVFFESPSPLSSLVEPGQNNVYEWESEGVGSCTTSSATFSASSNGCIYLLDSGASETIAQPEAARFLDATPSGDEVFIDTAAQLVPQDADNLTDVYDLRVDGGFPGPAPALPSCDGEACQGPAAPASAFSGVDALSSALLSGAGNLKPANSKPMLTRAQKHAKALRACHKKKRRKKRAECERDAHRRYGGTAKDSRHDGMGRGR